jgi:hypothetical protein
MAEVAACDFPPKYETCCLELAKWRSAIFPPKILTLEKWRETVARQSRSDNDGRVSQSRHAQQKYHFSSGLTHKTRTKKSAATPLDRKSMKKRSRRAIVEERKLWRPPVGR